MAAGAGGRGPLGVQWSSEEREGAHPGTLWPRDRRSEQATFLPLMPLITGGSSGVDRGGNPRAGTPVCPGACYHQQVPHGGGHQQLHPGSWPAVVEICSSREKERGPREALTMMARVTQGAP